VVLIRIFKLALESDNARLLDGQFRYIEQWISEWKLSVADVAELLLLVANLCRAAGQAAEHQHWVLKYLAALEKADRKTIETARPTAYLAVVAVLNSSTVYHFDSLLTSPAVKALKDAKEDPKYDAAYQLLHIFTVQNVDAYVKFTQERKDFVAQSGLNHEELLRKIRTLTLCSLGLEKERLSFDSRKQKLQGADALAVESAVLDAVVSQCLEAKLDEAREEVIVLRSTRRHFDSSGWKTLATQLADWKKNVQTVMLMLHQIQARAIAATVPPTPAVASQDHKAT